MLLSYTELCTLVDLQVIHPVEREAINAASIDVRLGTGFMRESTPYAWSEHTIDMAARESLNFVQEQYPEGGEVHLKPGEFILAHTMETFNLPDDISAQFLLKSSIGRNALNHMSALWCDAGWHGSVLTLELKNDSQYHTLILRPGMYIGQMKFFRHTPVPYHASYAVRGRYNNDRTVQQQKH